MKQIELEEIEILDLLSEFEKAARKLNKCTTLRQTQTPLNKMLDIVRLFIPCKILRNRNTLAYVTCTFEHLTEETDDE